MNLDGFESLLRRARAKSASGIIVPVRATVSPFQRREGWIRSHYGFTMHIVSEGTETATVEINCDEALGAIQRFRVLHAEKPTPKPTPKREATKIRRNAVYQAIAAGARNNKEIAAATGLAATSINPALSYLSAKGKIRRQRGMTLKVINAGEII